MHIQPKPSVDKSAIVDGDQNLEITGDEFLTADSMNPVLEQARERAFSQVLHDMEESFRQNRWEEILSIYYPVKEKLSELEKHPRLHQVRGKRAFALGQTKRFDEAIVELALCIDQAPNDYYHHNSLAYMAYNSLYAAKS
jgi:hypothetical protein